MLIKINQALLFKGVEKKPQTPTFVIPMDTCSLDLLGGDVFFHKLFALQSIP